MTQTTRFGIVGSGAIAQTWAQAFRDFEAAVVVSVADVRVEAAKAMGQGLQCESYASHEALLEGPELDAVIICTPPSTHAEICNAFLRRGVHVLCEKPLSTDLKSAQEMLATAEEGCALLTMASKFRYVDDVVRAKSIVESGILGEIVLFENAFTSRIDMSKRWNSDPKISGGGVLIDNGTHSLDLMRYFLGPLSEVQAVEGRRSQRLKVEETVRIFARSVDGVMGSVDLSWSINKELSSYIDIFGSQGTVSVGWKESRFRQSSSADWVVFGDGYSKTQAFRSQLDNFVKAIRKEEPLLITSEDGIGSVRAIEAAYRSLQRDQWVPVSYDEAPVRIRSRAAATG